MPSSGRKGLERRRMLRFPKRMRMFQVLEVLLRLITIGVTGCAWLEGAPDPRYRSMS